MYFLEPDPSSLWILAPLLQLACFILAVQQHSASHIAVGRPAAQGTQEGALAGGSKWQGKKLKKEGAAAVSLIYLSSQIQ